MDNSERLITAFYYSVGGIILGLGLAIFFSLYLSSTISSPKIVIFTVIFCFVIGYLFPNMVGNIFKWIWKIFVN
jgi:ABC-type antimicrobial peptide transport system permease subunit